MSLTVLIDAAAVLLVFRPGHRKFLFSRQKKILLFQDIFQDIRTMYLH